MDTNTAKDMVEDLQIEIASLRREIKTLTRVCEKAYPNHEHHAGCLRGMMCSCGLMHYHAWKESKK
jgi:hypothetical protein